MQPIKCRNWSSEQQTVETSYHEVCGMKQVPAGPFHLVYLTLGSIGLEQSQTTVAKLSLILK